MYMLNIYINEFQMTPPRATPSQSHISIPPNHSPTIMSQVANKETKYKKPTLVGNQEKYT